MEIVTLEPPVGGQLTTNIDQRSDWRLVEPELVERQVSYAHKIAAILGGSAFVGRIVARTDEFAALIEDKKRGANLLLLPHMTLCDEGFASAFRLSDCDIFGGAVSVPHHRTKVIMHDLVDPQSPRPERWNAAFARLTARFSLPGYSAFSAADIRTATAMILQRHGTARIKLAHGSGGEGHFLASSPANADDAIDAMQAAGTLPDGCVVEPNLNDTRIYGLDHSRLAGKSFCSFNRVHCDYANPTHPKEIADDNFVVRGDVDGLWAKMAAWGLGRFKRVVDLAVLADRAAQTRLAGLIKTRAGYQIIDGTDDRGRRMTGVLEPGWRRGGASASLLVAAHLLTRDPEAHWVLARNEVPLRRPVAADDWVFARTPKGANAAFVRDVGQGRPGGVHAGRADAGLFSEDRVTPGERARTDSILEMGILGIGKNSHFLGAYGRVAQHRVWSALPVPLTG